MEGMVATSHPLSTLAALDVLREGGNAIDAAVCAAAVQAVVEPTQTGIGGDCFALFKREEDESPVALNGSGWSPAAATADWYSERGMSAIPNEGAQAATVPGALRAWERLVVDHGRMPWARLLQPAIEAAERGVCVPERLARDWGRQLEKLRRNDTAAAIFLPEGTPPVPGAVHRQPLLAGTLRAVAVQGAQAFYEGEIASHLVATLRDAGGLHDISDFSDFMPEYVKPISVGYRGYDLWECPPNGQGPVPMLMAKVLERFDLSGWRPDSVERLHVQAEAARQAYAERDLYIGDPRGGEIPTEWLLSRDHVGHLVANISLSGRIERLDAVRQRPHKDTVFISVVDRDLTAVALINSLFDDFGSGLACKRTGVLFHNRASSFVLDRDHPNCIDGRKRPMHTIIPALLTKNGQAVMSFGVTGGHFQPIGQVQLLTNIVDYGMSVQAAIDYPRMFARGETFEVEGLIDRDRVRELMRLGHKVTRPENPLGTAQAVWIDRNRGLLRGGADPRRDGLAMGY